MLKKAIDTIPYTLLKDTVEIPQAITETYGRYSIRFQAATTWNNMQNALPINILSIITK